MKISLNRTFIIQALLLLVVLLLAANIILEKYSFQSKSNQIGLPAKIINERFLKSLFNYNLDSSWISERKIKPGSGDSLNYSYTVNIPSDLPIGLLLKEIENQFDTSEVNIYSAESKSHKSTEVKISSGGFLKLQSNLKYNSEIKRSTDSVAFIISGISDLNKESLENLLLIPEHFACILIPSKQSQDLFTRLKESKKESAILLNDDISELEFKLKNNYSDNRFKNSVKSIIGKFFNASFFIIDENSDIYNSRHMDMIKAEFKKRNMTLVEEKIFQVLKNSSPEKIKAEIQSNHNPVKIFKISAEEFIEMPPFLASLRKIGYKFVNPSELLNISN